VSGTPTVKFDGDHEVEGGLTNGTMYPVYRKYFDQHKTVASPLEIDMACTYDSAGSAGRLTIKVRNTTASSVSGQLQVALCENHLYYVWYGLDSVHHVVRNMLPDASGEAITVPANDSVTKERDFTIDAAWVARNCELIAFVQDNSSKTIYQGARVGVYQVPALAYLGYQSAYPEPGGTADLVVGLRNLGSGPAAGVSATLSTADPYVMVTGASGTFGDIAIGADVYSNAAFGISVSESCPDPHLATMDLAVTASGGYTGGISFPLNVTTERGFSDDIEGGADGWTHSGTSDNWHQTEHRNQTPTHSWYCGLENSWAYSNENDAKLVTPYFTAGDSAQLSFDHWYALEADYDYGMVEVNNGAPFWIMLGSFTDSSGSWAHVSYPVAGFSGQTLRCRFRFLSDYNTTAEGWYVDNFLCEPYQTSVAEPRPGVTWSASALRNPVTTRAELSFAVPRGQTGRLAVYDAGGRLVAEIADHLTGSGRVSWNLAGVEGGTYFARLTGGDRAETAKIIVAR
jgi:hypothetical protein